MFVPKADISMFCVHVEKDSKESITSGTGELHLEVHVERMEREHDAECVTGWPCAVFWEIITKHVHFNYAYKKQTGGAGAHRGHHLPICGMPFVLNDGQTHSVNSLSGSRRSVLERDRKLGDRGEEFTAVSEIPLNDMFGCPSTLHGVTSGKGDLSMEYKDHPVTTSLSKPIPKIYL
ncbi:uncharacterized protein BXZ73DRAFT_105025 [Epithele typhae]|uniref:uncharacterized protein n=1 Tax=Epithele typhae TaxID=378194 RepID=UPI002008EB42|nr:uncharacterized protein BXZ73DRAFT_105025 [Epithele typhae]KAH9919198.1 hypothetical protein BXZ73DRAFT_105025 [Epithele typhae]